MIFLKTNWLSRTLCLLVMRICLIQSAIVVDKVIARVNDEFILLSDLLETSATAASSVFGLQRTVNKSELLSDLIGTRALLCKAKRDNIKIDANTLNLAVKTNYDRYVKTFGSVSKVEEYFKKNSYAIKKELKANIENAFLIQNLKNKELREIEILPIDVCERFDALQKKEKIKIEEKFELFYIAKIVKPLDIDKKNIFFVLNNHKLKVENKEVMRFLDLSAFEFNKEWSDVKIEANRCVWKIGSADAPIYENFALKICAGKISTPFHTQTGTYLVHVLTRDIKNIEVEYIFFPYRLDDAALNALSHDMVNLSDKINSGEISFEKAFVTHSDSIDSQNIFCSKLLKGRSLKRSELSDELLDAIDRDIIIEGKITKPILFNGKCGDKILVIFYLKRRMPEHVACLATDFKKIRSILLKRDKEIVIKNLVQTALSEASIYIDSDYYC